MWNKFLLSPLEMRAFIDSFGSQRVGAWFDCGNVLATGYPQHWIDILGKRIVRVHVKDYRRAVGTTDGFVDLLSGDVDWPAVTAALKRIGYQGWVSAEMIPPANARNPAAVWRAICSAWPTPPTGMTWYR